MLVLLSLIRLIQIILEPICRLRIETHRLPACSRSIERDGF